MSAQKQEISITFLAVLTTALLVSTSLAVEGPEQESVKLQGFVSVLRDADDVITSVNLVTDEDVYNVVLDAKGLELGEEMEDEEVEVEGVVFEEDDQKWLEVLVFKTVEGGEK